MELVGDPTTPLHRQAIKGPIVQDFYVKTKLPNLYKVICLLSTSRLLAQNRQPSFLHLVGISLKCYGVLGH